MCLSLIIVREPLPLLLLNDETLNWVGFYLIVLFYNQLITYLLNLFSTAFRAVSHHDHDRFSSRQNAHLDWSDDIGSSNTTDVRAFACNGFRARVIERASDENGHLVIVAG